ncbi:DinB family protein [Novispirillum itersonii]|uniref:Putative damage-inducible protein DinB n=1 Tax=Novispirillum itersonii TaxID=189 RepID=A0A7W9ZF48_NOVIT|nr:DinB family protein [Novispirillum itersonii]MBB6210338.1 putative damage-inducible protein DinB [Novispirillum itersonii]
MTSVAPSAILSTLRRLAAYKQWANTVTFADVLALPPEEITRQRQTRFGSIVHTLNHIWVVDDIFRHHLLGQPHGYTARNTDTPPDIAGLWGRVQQMDDWYVRTVEGWTEPDAAEEVAFTFVGGGDGRMTRQDILLHIVNHGTYHRGFVSDMMYQAGVTPTANDYSVFVKKIPT